MPGQDILGTIYQGDQRIVTTGTATRLTVPAGAGSCFCSISVNPIRVRFDPTNLATATTGHLLGVGTTWEEAEPGKVSVIQDATLTGGVLEVTYFD